jgi:hypothetical protein
MNQSLAMISNIFLAGICFGIYPLLMKRCGLTPITQALILGLVSTFVVFSVFIFDARENTKGIFSTLVILAIMAAILNGIGWIFFLRAINLVTKQDVAKTVLSIIIIQLITNEVGGMLLLGSVMTIKKILGFIFGVITIVLLTI